MDRLPEAKEPEPDLAANIGEKHTQPTDIA